MLSKQEFEGVISLILKESIKAWGTIDLSYFGEWAQGCGFPKKYQGSTDGEILFCKVSDMNIEGNDIFIKKTMNTITLSLAKEMKVKIHPPGTVIFPKIGGAIATNKRRILSKNSAIDNNCTGIIPNKNSNSKWLYYMLRYFDFSLFQTGTSVPALNQDNLEKNVHLPRVPFLEQELISNFLDYLEEDPEDLYNAPKLPEQLESMKPQIENRLVYIKNLEALSKEYEIQPELISELRQTILQEAISGKLVPQETKDEPVSEILRKIEAEKKRLKIERKIKKEMPLPPISEEEIPFELPEGWEWVRFGQVTICRDGERIPVSEDERKLKERIYDYYGASGIIDKIDSYLFDKELLLIGEDGANLVNRSTPIAFLARGKYWVNNHAHVLDSIDLDILGFLKIYINAIDLKPYVTGTAQPKMNQSKMNSIVVAFPPFAEQKRIVKKVDTMMKLCDELERKVKENQETSEYLMEAVLKEAFALGNVDISAN